MFSHLIGGYSSNVGSSHMYLYKALISSLCCNKYLSETNFQSIPINALNMCAKHNIISLHTCRSSNTPHSRKRWNIIWWFNDYLIANHDNAVVLIFDCTIDNDGSLNKTSQCRDMRENASYKK